MKTYDLSKETKTFPIGIVVSRFNLEITSKLLSGALSRLETLGFSLEQVSVIHVPGAVEIPLACQQLAQLGQVKAIVALGAVIRGETTHYDYVCSQVSQGCQHVSLQNDIPLSFGVLTTEDEHQAFDRAGGKFGNKGAEAVDVAMEMVCLIEALRR